MKKKRETKSARQQKEHPVEQGLDDHRDDPVQAGPADTNDASQSPASEFTEQVRLTRKQKVSFNPDLAYLPVFARDVLGFSDLYPWQKRLFADIDPRWSRVAAVVCNGSGKTSRIGAGAALWNLLVCPGSTTVVTSGVYRQLKEQFMPSVRRIIRLRDLAGLQVNMSDVTVMETGSRLVAFTASDAGLFEGFHRTGVSDSLMVIVDEAKSVSDEIFQAIERCQPDRLLLISSAGAPRGALWRAFAKEQAFWKLHRVTALDCPHIGKNWIDFQVGKWGRDHPLVRSMVFSEWQAEEGESLVLDLQAFDRLIDQPPRHQPGVIFAGLDFAAGGDENVIAVVNGNRLDALVTWRETNTMHAASRFVAELRGRGIAGENVFADAGGIGRPILDAMRQMGFAVHEVNFGGRPQYVEAYLNRGTEIYYHLKGLIERRSIALGDDEELRQQLMVRRWTTTPNGKIRLESKEELRARGVPSPDRADAVALAFSTHGMDSALFAPVAYESASVADILEDEFGDGHDLTQLGIHADS